MTKDQEVSRWFAEQMGRPYEITGYYHPDDGIVTDRLDINDPACQMAIEDWFVRTQEFGRFQHRKNETSGRTWYVFSATCLNVTGDTIKDALIALWEASNE